MTIADTQCPWCKSTQAIIQDGLFRCFRCSYEADVSQPPPIRVIGWTTANDRDFKEFHCKTKEIYQAIVQEIREKGYAFSWGDHQSSHHACMPVINNGYKISCGPRTWGWIMADASGIDESNQEEYESAAMGYSFIIWDGEPIFPKKAIQYDLILPFEIKEE